MSAKLISIDEFNDAERQQIDSRQAQLVEKYRSRTGKEPDRKNMKALMAEARAQIMSERPIIEAKSTIKRPRSKKPESLKESEVTSFQWTASNARGRR